MQIWRNRLKFKCGNSIAKRLQSTIISRSSVALIPWAYA